MEFEGQIIKVLPKRSGTSERTGNQWETQGFVFEYKEHDTDPWHDRVYLETFDTNIMGNLVEGAIAKIGFRHSTDDYNGRTYNRVKMNSFELVGKPMEGGASVAQQQTQQAAQPVQGFVGQQLAPKAETIYPPQPQGEGKDDDLPF